MEKSIIEDQDFGSIEIRPYVDPKNPLDTGLAKEGMVVFPGSRHEIPMVFTTNADGSRVYKNGLNVNSSDVLSITDEKQREAKVKNIMKLVAHLENLKHYTTLNPNDKNFWSQVQTYRPDNKDHYKNMALHLNNDIVILDPTNNTKDLEIYLAILAGGYPEVGVDLNFAKQKKLRWYLYIERNVAKENSSIKIMKAKAIGKLTEIYEEKNHRLFYLSKALTSDSVSFRMSSNRDSIFSRIEDFLNGLGQVKTVTDAVNEFNLICDETEDKLLVRALISDAINNRILVHEGGEVRFKISAAHNNGAPKVIPVGSNSYEALEYFLNPLNQNSLEMLKKTIDIFWESGK